MALRLYSKPPSRPQCPPECALVPFPTSAPTSYESPSIRSPMIPRESSNLYRERPVSMAYNGTSGFAHRRKQRYLHPHVQGGIALQDQRVCNPLLGYGSWPHTSTAQCDLCWGLSTCICTLDCRSVSLKHRPTFAPRTKLRHEPPPHATC